MDHVREEYTHIAVKDENGSDFLCPVDTDQGSQGNNLDYNVCFERDVPERYAGNISIKNHK